MSPYSYLWWFLGAVSVITLLVLIFRSRARRMMRIAKALATDGRLPRPVRWLFRSALLIKVVPLPDFGLDEVLLLVGVILLLGSFRTTWRAILEETR